MLDLSCRACAADTNNRKTNTAFIANEFDIGNLPSGDWNQPNNTAHSTSSEPVIYPDAGKAAVERSARTGRETIPCGIQDRAKSTNGSGWRHRNWQPNRSTTPFAVANIVST